MQQTRRLTAADNHKLYKQLSVIIRKQIVLFELNDFFVDLWTPIILMHFLTGAIIICVVSINLIMATSGTDLFLYNAFVSTVLLQILVYAVGGNRMAESVSSIYLSSSN